MQMSEKGKTLLTKWEGFETKEYLDVAGLPTIGVGHLLTQAEKASKRILIGGQSVDYSQGLTEAQVGALLTQDLQRFEAAVTNTIKVSLDAKQFDALVSFSFNVGIGAFAGSTLVRLLNEGKYTEVPNELRKWVKADGKTSQGLVARRENEIKLWSGTI